jgi:hypothetical protein
LEKHAVSIFRAKVVMLGSGGIYIRLEERKAEGVGQSGTRNEREMVLDPEDGDSMFLRNVGIYRRVYMAPNPRRTSSSRF